MKTDTLVIIGAAAVGLYFISKVAKSMSAAKAPTVTGAARQSAVSMGLWSDASQPTLTLPQQYGEYGNGRAMSEGYGTAGYTGTTQ